ncbi:hemolysin family protein [Peredibacter starrii]|uniref:Hemolysin family protein n=1 Tax=Peredibacter starrii TaxID=28202 RepID=A0AAX4HR16_9BACT|nr:hemolysin family protein [Peredibacter starrii]WPU65672.1 hemolysin family protein [Peredibacter starrii]
MSTDQEILVLVVSLLLSAFFSGSEAALLSLPHEKAKQIAEEHGLDSWAMKRWLQMPNDILTTILVGNNFVNILIATLSASIAERFFSNDALAISVGVTTMMILLFGEIAPKTVGRGHSEKFAATSVLILTGFYYLMWPVVKAFTKIIQLVLGKNANVRSRAVTKDDIEVMVEMAEETRTMDSKQIDLLNSILEFPSIKVKDIMVPRTSIEAIKKDSSFLEVIKMVREVAHSRYPVYDEDLDDVLGFLHVKDLAFMGPDEQKNFDITKYVKPPFFVYEHMKIQAVFDHMNRKKVHLALVKDENGIVVGMLTLEDIMEEIFGEIQDEHDDEEDLIPGVESAEGVLVPSTISLRDLYNEYDIEIPLNDNYSTLNGFLMEQLGNSFPKKGHLIIWDGYSFELVRVKSSEIKEVKIKSTTGLHLREPDKKESKETSDNDHHKAIGAK